MSGVTNLCVVRRMRDEACFLVELKFWVLIEGYSRVADAVRHFATQELCGVTDLNSWLQFSASRAL